ncbi:MAG: diacylglycerol kinase family protein [Bacteroidetes bacterium]|jgi:diacylglycerol kinase|nr:diacylglycerol kinase family protein [Bacteroidota bacterium]MBT5527975.1 diacylglycerol kinase family protein [Cytophagia bacterium]MBT3422530.1 diacylglycerol kinase family protein [Bacteroidota bacterium]MBT3801489.1 diacylglycerol kinase family protein [Bacteroidota bacterium]MBT3934662.1 diacylglycerol kinase family protein [Bacteroidota bacterium]
MKKEYKVTIIKRLRSFVYAHRGIIFLFKSQGNMVIHSIAAVLAVIIGILLKINMTEWCLIFFAIGFVFVSEAINTAIEQFIDFISPSYHFSAGRAKDVAAGAVLFAATTALVVGLIIFIPKIVDLLVN